MRRLNQRELKKREGHEYRDSLLKGFWWARFSRQPFIICTDPEVVRTAFIVGMSFKELYGLIYCMHKIEAMWYNCIYCAQKSRSCTVAFIANYIVHIQHSFRGQSWAQILRKLQACILRKYAVISMHIFWVVWQHLMVSIQYRFSAKIGTKIEDIILLVLYRNRGWVCCCSGMIFEKCNAQKSR